MLVGNTDDAGLVDLELSTSLSLLFLRLFGASLLSFWDLVGPTYLLLPQLAHFSRIVIFLSSPRSPSPASFAGAP
jgi:hypothetical protein